VNSKINRCLIKIIWNSNKTSKIKDTQATQQPPEPAVTYYCEACDKELQSKSSYDGKFDKEIRKLRPDWFENSTLEKKKELLE
jgi:hypothetical protein